MSKLITFRISNIPPDLTFDTVSAYLAKCVPELGEATNIRTRSLAASPYAIISPPDQVATVDFDEVPQCLSSSREHSWAFKVSSASLLSITSVKTVVLLTIHGLARPPFGSWRQRVSHTTNEQYMWLRDQLPHDIPNAKVFIYGYDTKLQHTQSFQGIEDLAKNLRRALMRIGTTEHSARCMIIFAHSLRGILIKRAIQHLALGGPADVQILHNIRLVVFFGVPHGGLTVNHLKTIVEGQPNQELIQKLSTGSETLHSLDDSFKGILSHHPIRVVSAYETVRTRVAQAGDSGSLERSGEEQVLVSRQSAIHPLSTIDDTIQIDRDHSNMVKFCYNDPDYLGIRQAIVNSLKDLSERAKVLGSSQLAAPQQSEEKDNDPSTFLKFHELDLRYHAIENAHESSFAWLLDDHNLDFLEWIRNGQRAYWIRGKPASGKSTLFRYLHDNAQFRDLISNHTSRVEHFNVWYFFTIRGSQFAQSIEALLCNILWQLAKSNAMLKSIITRFYRPRLDAHSERWTSQEIKDAFAAVMDQSFTDIQISVFIDALDEFYGLPVAIAVWIKSQIDLSQRTSSRTVIRFCFSSREWDSFVLAFANEPGFSAATTYETRYKSICFQPFT